MFWSPARAARKLAFAKAHMRVGDKWTEIQLANVSSSGVMAKCERPPKVGTEVELKRRGAQITGKVVWAASRRFAVRSSTPIDHAALLAASDLQPDRRNPAHDDVDRRAESRWWCWQKRL